ncbi:MAG: hypothetical protein IJW92_00920 [Clostridia bacterium]|nr:hypothetical protein [Clostridia bacterium]
MKKAKLLSMFLAVVMLLTTLTSCLTLGKLAGIGDTDTTTGDDNTTTTTENNGAVLDPAVQKLADANDLHTIMETYDSYSIQCQLYEENTVSYEIVYSFSKLDGDLLVEEAYLWGDGTVDSVINAYRGAIYEQYSDGELWFSVFVDAETDLLDWANLGEFDSAYVVGALQNEMYEEFDYEVSYDFTADSETDLLQTATYTLTDENGDIWEQWELTYSYGTELDSVGSAYQAIANAEDAVTLNVDFSSVDETAESRTYTVSALAYLFETEDEEAWYVFYKNPDCTKDVWDLTGLEAGDSATVYVGLWDEDIVPMEYTLTEETYDAYLEALALFEEEALADGAEMDAVERAYGAAMDLYDYIEMQYYVAYLDYYSDLQDETYTERYDESYAMVTEAHTAMMNTLKKIAESDSPLKEELFEGWTEEDMAMLDMEREKLDALEQESNRIVMEYNALAMDDAWNGEVNRLYEEFVAINQQIAAEYGFDNYYEYATQYIYMRDYSAEDRERMRQYAVEYIYPLYQQCYDRYMALMQSPDITANQWNQFVYLATYDYDTLSTDYLTEYIETFEGSMYEKMIDFLYSETVLFVDDTNAAERAFTGYFSYYETPFCYFGPGYQNLLTVTHEMGHYISHGAFGDIAYSLDLSETHSQANEWLMIAYLEGRLDENVSELLTLYRALTGLSNVLSSLIVDEFEEAVYTAETPVTAAEFDQLMLDICAKYEGIEESFDMVTYVKYVSILQPVYYISYATSEISSISLYLIAEENYATAQEIYRKLQEDIDPTAGFLANVELAGLMSPFAEETYVALQAALAN